MFQVVTDLGANNGAASSGSYCMSEYLKIKWTVSRARDTYGYNICTLTDTRGRKSRCNGGGYDMVGTVLGDYLGAWYQDELLAIKDKAASTYDKITGKTIRNGSGLYGLTHITINGETSYLSIDGACGTESVLKIARAAGIELREDVTRGTWILRPAAVVVDSLTELGVCNE